MSFWQIISGAAVGRYRLYFWLGLAISAVGILGTVYFSGYRSGVHSVQADWDAEKAAQTTVVRDLETKQANVSTQSEQAHTEANTRIQTIFKDRFVYITREAKNAKAENPACTIPTRFISVWNSANRAEPIPEASGQSDDSASGITLDDIAAQHDREAEQYHINAQRLSDLQHWVNEQVRVSEEVSK
ncbi:MAG: hypothetical protein WAS93_04925 [Burkholderiaceae bacterium]